MNIKEIKDAIYDDILQSIEKYEDYDDPPRLHEFIKCELYNTALKLGYIPYPEMSTETGWVYGRKEKDVLVRFDMVWFKDKKPAIIFEIQNINNINAIKRGIDNLQKRYETIIEFMNIRVVPFGMGIIMANPLEENKSNSDAVRVLLTGNSDSSANPEEVEKTQKETEGE